MQVGSTSVDPDTRLQDLQARVLPRSSFVYCSLSLSRFYEGNAPKVLEIGAIPGVYNVFWYEETLRARNVTFHIFTYDLAYDTYDLAYHLWPAV